MQMTLTYTADDIKRAIRHDLARQGIPSDDVEIKYTKNQAIITINITVDDTPPVTQVQAPVAAPAPSFHQPVHAAPALEVIDGGNAPVDMSGLLQASAKIARTTEGKFPTPKHTMLEGESSEWPGPKDSES